MNFKLNTINESSISSGDEIQQQRTTNDDDDLYWNDTIRFIHIEAAIENMEWNMTAGAKVFGVSNVGVSSVANDSWIDDTLFVKFYFSGHAILFCLSFETEKKKWPMMPPIAIVIIYHIETAPNDDIEGSNGKNNNSNGLENDPDMKMS